VLMGLKRSAGLAKILIERGWASATPSAAIFEASRPEQHVWRGTLDDIASNRIEATTTGPATIVIGDVVNAGMESGAEVPTHLSTTRITYVNG
jgi:siroheme synthase